jgi:hypothetical protein
VAAGVLARQAASTWTISLFCSSRRSRSTFECFATFDLRYGYGQARTIVRAV